MKKILAIGGAVVKTARTELIKLIESKEVEMLIHNGGSLFHDFQHAVDPPPEGMHSYSLEHLMHSQEELLCTNERVRDFFCLRGNPAPKGSVTRLCRKMNIPVLVFTALGCDWWQFEMPNWTAFAVYAKNSFDQLVKRFATSQFHYVCMGSAVIHPEVFVKALALSYASEVNNWFRADVVDFLDMYRPKTRVAKYGNYFLCGHKRFINQWLENGYPEMEVMEVFENELSDNPC
jgi:hypothetical protein